MLWVESIREIPWSLYKRVHMCRVLFIYSDCNDVTKYTIMVLFQYIVAGLYVLDWYQSINFGEC